MRVRDLVAALQDINPDLFVTLDPGPDWHWSTRHLIIGDLSVQPYGDDYVLEISFSPHRCGLVMGAPTTVPRTEPVPLPANWKIGTWRDLFDHVLDDDQTELPNDCQ